MSANFEFLQRQTEYALFANACIEAERGNYLHRGTRHRRGL
jgi:hypothetical protein